MNILCFDSATNGLCLELSRDGELFSSQSIDQKNSENLLVAIDNLLKKAGLVINDIDVFAATRGPGSFTGIRVGLATLKAFALTTKAKIVVWTSFDQASYNVVKPDTDFITIIRGFSTFNYVQTKNCVFCLDTDDLLLEVSKSDKVVCDFELANKLGINNDKIITPNKSLINVALDFVKNNKFQNVRDIEALYIRPSQAEMQQLNKISNKTKKEQSND